MLRFSVIAIFIFSLSFISLAQQKNPVIETEPIVVYDGIIVPSAIAEILMSVVYQYKIAEVSILEDSIYDCSGNLVNQGLVKIHSIDTENLAAKKIMAMTKGWLFTHPLTSLEINKVPVAWDERTYLRLISLAEEDVVSAKIKVKSGDNCDATLRLRVK